MEINKHDPLDATDSNARQRSNILKFTPRDTTPIRAPGKPPGTNEITMLSLPSVNRLASTEPALTIYIPSLIEPDSLDLTPSGFQKRESTEWAELLDK